MPRTTSSKTLTPPRIGAYWPGQGGYLAALMRGENGQPDYYLIVAGKEHFGKDLAWGPRDALVAGAGSEYDGELNTLALLSSGHDHPIATYTRDLVIDGHNDFYVPARREARAIWANGSDLLPGSWIWTSTQGGAHGAWYQDSIGGQYWGSKNDEGAVVPVRRLLAIE